MLFSVMFDAVIASIIAFAFVNIVLFAFGNLFVRSGRKILALEEIIKEIRNIISEEAE